MNTQSVSVDLQGLEFSAEVAERAYKLEIRALTEQFSVVGTATYECGRDYLVEGHLRCILQKWASEHPNGGTLSIEFIPIDLDEQALPAARREITITQPMIASLRAMSPHEACAV